MKEKIIEIFEDYSYTDNSIGNIIKEEDWSVIAIHILGLFCTYEHAEPKQMDAEDLKHGLNVCLTCKGLKDYDVSKMLPELEECNQASYDYADKHGNGEFGLVRVAYQEGINWALNYLMKRK